eukprot:Unigene12072_Nuclearia_a/m.36715 Unigene12072_Nuclearia_a/g.36715  ORF Unigene12072_Nuclearia_a/g.36715 Unigene12072_Nuclearia_a/m.36715 type:complete len:1543 (-) Unigene12072_Nuclearia_a:72-4700(-)
MGPRGGRVVLDLLRAHGVRPRALVDELLARVDASTAYTIAEVLAGMGSDDAEAMEVALEVYRRGVLPQLRGGDSDVARILLQAIVPQTTSPVDGRLGAEVVADAVAMLRELASNTPIGSADRFGLEPLWTPDLGCALVRSIGTVLVVDNCAALTPALVERIAEAMFAAIESDAGPVRRLCIDVLLPQLFVWDAQHGLGRRRDWAERLWELVKQLLRLHAELREDAYGILARLVDAAAAAIDLRLDQDFFTIVQQGLEGVGGALANKRSTYALRRVIQLSGDLTLAVNADLDSKPWTRYFCWSAAQAKQLTHLWNAFFTLCDTLDQSSVHLVKAVWGELECIMLGTPALDASWWALLLRKGMTHDPTIRRFVLHRVLESTSEPFLRKLSDDASWELVFAPLLAACNEAALYKTIGFSAISAMGELLVSFLHRTHAALVNADAQIVFLRRVLRSAAVHHYHSTLMIHVLQFLTEAVPTSGHSHFLDKADINLVVDIDAGFFNERATAKRGLIRWYLLSLVISRSDAPALDFDTVALLLHQLYEPELLALPDGALAQPVRSWLRAAPLADALAEEARRVLQTDTAALSSDDMTFDRACERLNRLCAFASADSPAIQGLRSELWQQVDAWTAQGLAAPLETPALAVLAAMDACNGSTSASLLRTIGERCSSSWARVDVADAGPSVLRTMRTIWRFARVCNALVSATPADALRADDVSDWARSTASACRAQLDALHPATSAVARQVQLVCTTTVAAVAVAALASGRGVHALGDEHAALVQSLLQARIVRPHDATLNHPEWHALVERFQADKWAALEQLVAQVAGALPPSLMDALRTVWAGSVEALSMVAATECGPVLRVMERCAAVGVPADLLTVDDLHDACSAVWALVRELWDYQAPSTALLTAVAPVVFAPVLFRHHPAFHAPDGPLQTLLAKVLKAGEGRAHILAVVARHFHRVWTDDETLPAFEHYLPAVVEMLLFGPCKTPRRSDFVAAELLDEETRTGPSEEQTAQSIAMDREGIVRAYMNALLAHLRPGVARHVECGLMVLNRLLYGKHATTSARGVFDNTPEHRRRMRLWQSVLVLLPLERDAEQLRRIVERCFQYLITQEHSISVRYLIEFVIVRCVCAEPSLASGSFLIHWRDFNERAAVMCSMGSMTLIIGRSLRAQAQATFLQEAIPLMLPWGVCNHYNVRLMAVVTCQKLCEIAQTVTVAPREMEAAVASNVYLGFVNDNLEYQRHREKLEEEFFFDRFDLQRDYSWQFVFHDVLVITNVAQDDAIGADIFHLIDPRPPTFLNGQVLSAAAQASRLRGHYKIDVRHIRSKPWLEGDADPVTEQPPALAGLSPAMAAPQRTDEGEGQAHNYQRKIQPWEQLLSSDTEVTRETVHTRQRHELIVVASLLDKLPNLGGICRTCEIFNASKLVLADTRVVDNPQFKNVSVTAENWLPIEEVQADRLEPYLRGLQAQGYRVLGVEQTANSVSLESYVFPAKTVLVLGREKEGIPVELIQLLDACIEIPQFGLLRSLNVHVSGAILVWEYTRQRLLRSRS